jgi:citrate lyase subunit beta/citryl-CoA lyase
MERGAVRISVVIESALGVYRCFELAQSSPRVAIVCLGAARDGDLQSDLGCSWSLEGTELLYARSKVLLDTRAANGDIHPMTGPYADLDDEAGLVEDSRLCARLGYVGRNVIHPKQIVPARRAYAVAAADIAYYQKVVSEFEAAEKAGSAAIKVDGRLIDYAMYKRAQRVLELAKLDL